MNIIKKFLVSIYRVLQKLWELTPFRPIWEVWALTNIIIILVLVVESIWLPDLNDNISRFILDLYVPDTIKKSPSCQ